jgi:hypothetical protein
VRELLPYKKYQRDNAEFLAGYLNEIKPFHVKIKNFAFKYDGINTYPGDVTDFDLPAQYNSTTGTFETPQLVYSDTETFNQYTANSAIWQEPQYREWFAATGLEITNKEAEAIEAATLTRYVTPYDTVISVSSVTALPDIGSIIMGTEIASYDRVDRINNLVIGLVRGVRTPAVAHLPGERIILPTSSVVVLDTGRAYTEPPVVTAYIDTAVYPQPRTPAVLSAVMSNDRLIGITVVDPGSGYVVTPQIRIAPSRVKKFAFNTVDVARTGATKRACAIT